MAAAATVVTVMALCACSSVADLVVQTSDGPVLGSLAEDGQTVSWKGIPYAAPPVGDLRWESPQPVTPWTTTRNASQYGDACAQTCLLPAGACQLPSTSVSEDCLFLNVWAPTSSVGEQALPVMMWIHGGRFEQGSAGVALYDGSRLAVDGPCVIVTINYRLGVLGFFTNKDAGITGNFAIQDQVLALKWVHTNIRAFGGDPSRVTIFGQSAGGASVLSHMISPNSWPFFHQAIGQSAPAALPVLTLDEAEDHYKTFAQHSKCAHADKSKLLDCLKALNWEGIIEAQTSAQKKIFLTEPLSMFMPWSPVVDEKVIPGSYLEQFSRGAYNKVPFVIGHVAEEARMFVYEAFLKPMSKVEMDALIRLIYPGDGVAKAIFQRYPYPDPKPSDYRDWLCVLASDFVIACPSRNISSMASGASDKTYRYIFNHSWEIPGLWGRNMTFCEGHVCHGGELPFVFDSGNKSGIAMPADELQLGRQMSALWASFAASGTPAASGWPQWPPHAKTSDLEYALQVDPKVLPHERATYCDFWDNLGYNFK